MDFLKRYGMLRIIVNNGKQALDRLEAKNYDLILMDCQMSIMDGYEATKNIINRYKSNRPRIYALTASAMKEDKERCYAAGMEGFLLKPLRPKILKDVLSSVLKYVTEK